MTCTQEMLFGLGWLIVGLGTAVAGQVWIGIAMIVFGIGILAYSWSGRHRS